MGFVERKPGLDVGLGGPLVDGDQVGAEASGITV